MTRKCDCGRPAPPPEPAEEKTCYEIVRDDGIYCSECNAFWEISHRGLFAHCPYCGTKIVERTDAELAESLMPCPFCGGEATVGTYKAKPFCVEWGVEDADGEDTAGMCPCCSEPPKVTETGDEVTYYVVHCLNRDCPAKPCVNDKFLHRSSAVDAWNTRLCCEHAAPRPLRPPYEPKPLYEPRPKPECPPPFPGNPQYKEPPKPLYKPKPKPLPRNGRERPVFSVQREVRYDGIPVVHVPVYVPADKKPETIPSKDCGCDCCKTGDVETSTTEKWTDADGAKHTVTTGPDGTSSETVEVEDE